MTERLQPIANGVRLLMRRWYVLLGVAILAFGVSMLLRPASTTDAEATMRIGIGQSPRFEEITPMLDRIGLAATDPEALVRVSESVDVPTGISVEYVPAVRGDVFADVIVRGPADAVVPVANALADDVIAVVGDETALRSNESLQLLEADLAASEQDLADTLDEMAAAQATAAGAFAEQWNDPEAYDDFNVANERRQLLSSKANGLQVEVGQLGRETAAKRRAIEGDVSLELLRRPNAVLPDAASSSLPIAFTAAALLLTALLILAESPQPRLIEGVRGGASDPDSDLSSVAPNDSSPKKSGEVVDSVPSELAEKRKRKMRKLSEAGTAPERSAKNA